MTFKCYICGKEFIGYDYLESPSFKNCKIPCESCAKKLKEEQNVKKRKRTRM